MCEQGADITVGVDDVCSLGQTNVTDLKLGELRWVIKIDVIDDREGATDGVGQATAAGFVETGGKAINATEEQELPVLGRVFDERFYGPNVDLILQIAGISRDIINTLPESEVLGGPADGG